MCLIFKKHLQYDDKANQSLFSLLKKTRTLAHSTFLYLITFKLVCGILFPVCFQTQILLCLSLCGKYFLELCSMFYCFLCSSSLLAPPSFTLQSGFSFLEYGPPTIQNNTLRPGYMARSISWVWPRTL